MSRATIGRMSLVLVLSPFFLTGGVPPAATSLPQRVGELSVDRSGYIEAGSDKIFFESAGTGPAMILIHDGLVHREVWDAPFEFFSHTHRVIRYDRRGYGMSPAPTGPFSDIEDLKSLFAHLVVDKACLVGMSSGGRLAIDFTLQYPQRVSSLILVGAVVGGLGYTEHFNHRGGHMPPDLPRDQRRAYFATDDPYEIYPENTLAREKVRQLVESHPAADHGAYASSPPAEPAVRRLSEIKVPTLVLVGEFDIPDVHAHAGAINAGIRGSIRDIIPKAGHLIPIEQPILFNDAVSDFLEGLSRGPRLRAEERNGCWPRRRMSRERP